MPLIRDREHSGQIDEQIGVDGARNESAGSVGFHARGRFRRFGEGTAFDQGVQLGGEGCRLVQLLDPQPSPRIAVSEGFVGVLRAVCRAT